MHTATMWNRSNTHFDRAPTCDTYRYDPYANQYQGGSEIQAVMPSMTCNNQWADAAPFTGYAHQHLRAQHGYKMYRHNPYVTISTTNVTELVPTPVAAGAPVYDPRVMNDNSPMDPMMAPGPCGVTTNIQDQFNLAQTACTARGRTLLLNVIRLQHADKIELIFQELCDGFAAVITDPQGCHVLRFIVEYLPKGSRILGTHLGRILTPELANQLCTHSQHSRRVVQALVEHHGKSEDLQPLVEMVCQNGQAVAIAKTQQGCIAIMRMLEHLSAPLRTVLYEAIAPSFADLIMHQYGNYTVQTAIQTIESHLLFSTFKEFRGRYVSLSCSKFGSNVMEKMVRCADANLAKVLLAELCYEPLNLQKLINDNFGNFVIQSLLEITAGSKAGHHLYGLVRPLLEHSQYGAKVEAKLRAKRIVSINNDFMASLNNQLANSRSASANTMASSMQGQSYCSSVASSFSGEQ